MSAFETEANKLLSDVLQAVEYAMPVVGEDIRVCISEHILHDVYDQSPNSGAYPRSYTLYNAALSAGVTAGAGHVVVNFNPSGERPGTWAEMGDALMRKYGKKPSDPIKPNPVSGDDFIQRIETGKGYDYKTNVGARPFLSRSIEELVEGKRALATFISAMNAANADLKVTDAGDAEIFRTGDDYF